MVSLLLFMLLEEFHSFHGNGIDLDSRRPTSRRATTLRCRRTSGSGEDASFWGRRATRAPGVSSKAGNQAGIRRVIDLFLEQLLYS